MKLSSRNKLMALMLATAIGLFVFDPVPLPAESQVGVSAAIARQASEENVREQSSGALLELRRRTYPVDVSPQFSVKSWAPPPPPPPPPAPPQAPALPFQFVGKQLSAEGWLVFVSINGQALIASEGTLLTDNYQVKQIQPPIMTLVYLPLHQTQNLSIGLAP